MQIPTKVRGLSTSALLLLPIILIVGLYLRIQGIPHGTSFHPDERFIMMTVGNLSPADMNPHAFAYGSLPFYALWGTSQVASLFNEFLGGYDGLFFVGRALNTCFALITIIFAFLIGRKVYQRTSIGLFAAAFLSLNVFFIQNSCFFTVDMLLTLCGTATLYCLLCYLDVHTEAKVRPLAKLSKRILGALFVALALIAIVLSFVLSDYRELSLQLSLISCMLFGLPGIMLLFASWFSSPGLKEIFLLVTAGIFIGLGVAAKISALLLCAPLGIAALLQLWQKKKLLSPLEWSKFLVLVPIVPLVVFAVAPYSFLDFEKFYRDTLEQLNMARGQWRPPYTIQYWHTTPYLYPLKQILNYTMGLPLGLACILGTLWVFGKQIFRRDAREIVLASWVVLTFISIGAYQVKYPRYLLPVYPVFMVFAAAFLVHLGDRLIAKFQFLRNIQVPALLVGAWTAVYALAFINIYDSNGHPYQIASRWIYKAVPAGSSILHVHWDDTLPLHLPGFAPSLYRTHTEEWSLDLYEKDTSQKVQQWSEKLSQGDYIFLPTQRIQGSVPRIPEELPQTTALLKLLFAEKLGFRLVKTFKNRPHIAGLTFNDDLADESFTVYDHPKVSIFKKVDRLSSEEIKFRIENSQRFEPLPDLSEMMSKTAAEGTEDAIDQNVPAAESRAPSQPEILYVLSWFMVLELLAFSVAPLIALALPRAQDLGFGISKCLGILLLGLTSWILCSFHIMPFTPLTLWIIALTMFGLATLLVSVRWGGWEFFLKRVGPSLLIVEALFIGGSLLILLVRACNPEIYWGEKPMDFTFLNFFTRIENLPPEDPWASGSSMHYYYLGTYLFAAIHKLSGVDTSVGYNLSIATLAGLLLTSAYGVLVSLCRTRWYSALGACAVCLLSNYEAINRTFWTFFGTHLTLNFDSVFWRTSRVFQATGFDAYQEKTYPWLAKIFSRSGPDFALSQFVEHPLWSLLFADLHAHVIAVSFTFVLLALSIQLLRAQAYTLSATSVLFTILYGIVLGSLFLINTWDFLTFGFYSALLWLSITFVGPKQIPMKKRCLTSFIQFAGVLLVSLLIIIPFVIPSGSLNKAEYNWVRQGEFNWLEFILRHLALWLMPLFFSLALIKSQTKKWADWNELKHVGIALLAASFPFLLGLWSYLSDTREIPWSILGLSSLLIFLGVWVCWKQSETRAVKTAGVFMVAAGVIMSIVELVYLADRMNTIFKFYNPIWTFLAFSCVILLPRLATSARSIIANRFAYSSKWKMNFSRIGLVVALLCATLGLAGSAVEIWIMFKARRTDTPWPTLNGMAYLDRMDSDEALAIRWIRDNIRGLPHVLEAHGISYGPYTRIAMHTGLPTVLGWQHHVKQRGLSELALRQRENDIREIYQASNPAEALKLLGRYQIELIVWGNLERSTYQEQGLRLMEANPELFPLLYRVGNTSIFTTVYSTLNAGINN